MLDPEPPRVQRLTGKVNVSKILRTIDVTLLAHQRVPAQSRLEAYLVALAGSQADLDQRGLPERLEHLVIAGRFAGFGVARMRLLLDERGLIPDQVVAPGPPGRR